MRDQNVFWKSKMNERIDYFKDFEEFIVDIKIIKVAGLSG